MTNYIKSYIIFLRGDFLSKKLSKVIISLLVITLLSFATILSACGENKKTCTIQFKVAQYISSINNSVVYKVKKTIDIDVGECIGDSAPDGKYGTGYTYEFAGWYTEIELINSWNLYKDEVRTNMVLYAKYIKK